MNEKERFLILLAKLEVVFPSSLSPEEKALRAQVYWEELSNFPIEQVEYAVKVAIRELKFFPKISDIIDIIKDNLPKFERKKPIYLMEGLSPEEKENILEKEREKGLENIKKIIDMLENVNRRKN